MQMINAALALAEMGFRVFPCVKGTKEPATAHGCLDATSDVEQVAKWWGMWPEHNVAISTDGLLVVDLDPVDDKQNPWLDDESRMKELMRGACSITPRGGRHCWFRQPTGENYRSTASKLAAGVDTRANGGYVVAPPSIVGGKPYYWAAGYELDGPPGGLPLAPASVLACLNAASKERGPGTAATPNEIREGSRNDTLARIAGHARRGGMSENEIVALLRAANAERCRPPIEDDEVSKIAWSVARYEPDQITVALVENWAGQDAMPAPQIENPGELPTAFCDVPGLLGDVIKWNLDTALKPQPPMALASAIALMGTITGRKITDQLNSRTNVYTVCLANTGVGKEHARKVSKEILQRANMEKWIGPEGIGSHAGLVSAVAEQPEILIQIDEIGRFLQTANNPGASPHLYQIITVMLKMFSSSNSLYVGDAYADLKKVKKIEQPHLCVYGTTVEKSFFDSLSTESLTDGFVGRLLVFESEKTKPTAGPDVGKDFAPPESILDAVRFWRDYQPGGLLGGVIPRPRRIADSQGAATAFSDLADTAEAMPDGSIRAAIWVRAHEKARKLAMIYAVSESRETLEISGDAAEWACAIVRHLTKRMEWLADRHVADGAFWKSSQVVYRLIDDAGKDGITAGTLCRATRNLKPRERAEIIDGLIQQGQVVRSQSATGGRPLTGFKSANFA